MKARIEKHLANILMSFVLVVPAVFGESSSLSDMEFEAAHFEKAPVEQQRVVGLPQRGNRALDMGDVIRVDAGRGGRNIQDSGNVVRIAPRGRGAIDCGEVISIGRQACPRFRER